jgi:cold shock CspA family protein
MGRSQESMQKKAVRQKKEKKRKDKEKRRLENKEQDKNTFDDMIAYVDEFGNILESPPDPSEKEEVELEDIEVSVAKSDPNEVVDVLKNGVVSFFDESKGFGFIRDLDTDQRIFVHVSNLNEAIKENNMVTFEIGKGPKGPTAMNVSVVR